MFKYVCVRAKSLQLCLTLWDTMDGSPPGSCVHGDSPGKNWSGFHALLQKIFPPKDPTSISYVSRTGRQFFNLSATWEAHVQIYYLYIYIFPTILYFFLREPEENVFQDSIKE